MFVYALCLCVQLREWYEEKNKRMKLKNVLTPEYMLYTKPIVKMHDKAFQFISHARRYTHIHFVSIKRIRDPYGYMVKDFRMFYFG